jgi:glutamate-1-semialdehyde 2,1-aminomutase
MQWATTTLAVCGLGAAALATSMLTLGRRLELSQAKHRSLAGHARMARRLAGFVPFYDFDEERFFTCDGAPADIAGRRRSGFARLSEFYKSRFAETIRRSVEAAAWCARICRSAASCNRPRV